MRSMTSIALAAATSLLCAVQADAAVYGGFSRAAGMARSTTFVGQGSDSAVNASCRLSVLRSNGIVDYPVWVIAGPGKCIAAGADYQITMTVLSGTETSIKIEGTAGACALKGISFGGNNSHCGFDLTLPNPGTPGSGQGLNPTSGAAGLVGMWNASINLDGAVILAGNPLIGDLYSRLTVSFSACFDDGDVFEFKVDTDKL